jgi:DNA repair photolyase
MKILSRPKKNAEEYGRWAVNPYVGCSNQCEYCYLRKGPSGKYLGQPKAVLKKNIVSEYHAYHLAMAEILENREQIIRDGGLFMTFTSDPCLPETNKLFTHILADCIRDHGIPVTLLTKNYADVYSWINELRIEIHTFFINGGESTARYNCDNLSSLAIGFTLTGHDELEPNAPSNAKRVKNMAAIKDFIGGDKFHVWASIEPVIDFDASFRMIQQALDAGCEHFKIGLMTERTKVCRRGFTLGGRTFDPYDPARCLAFVQDVMQQTRDRATVYWKQSFRDFIGGTGKHRLFSDGELHKIFDDYPNAVGKDWSMFNPQNK